MNEPEHVEHLNGVSRVLAYDSKCEYKYEHEHPYIGRARQRDIGK